MIKKFFFVFLILFVSSFTHAQEIKVVTEEYGPYNFTQNNEVTGFCTEIVKVILKKVGLKYELKSYPWPRAYNMALNDENILIYSIRRTKDREALFKWGGVIAKSTSYLYKLKSRKDVKVKLIEDAKKYLIATIPDDSTTLQLQKLGFVPKKNLLLNCNRDTNLKMIFMQKADLIPLSEQAYSFIAHNKSVVPKKLIKTISIPDNPTEFYMAFSRKTSADIVQRCQKALKEIKEDGTYEIIRKKWL